MMVVTNKRMYWNHDTDRCHRPLQQQQIIIIYPSSSSSLMVLFILVLMFYDSFAWGFTFPLLSSSSSSSSSSSFLSIKKYNSRISFDQFTTTKVDSTCKRLRVVVGPYLLFATMYLPDDWVDDDDNINDTNNNNYNDDWSSTTKTSFTIPPILHSPEWVAPLARIAAEYTKRLSNHPYNNNNNNYNSNMGTINVQQINHVQITNVATSHIDIEAIVCENDACVSLNVPVPFTQPCIVTTTTTSLDSSSSSSQYHHSPSITTQQQQIPLRDKSFEDCVVQNIQALDTEQLQQQAAAAATTPSLNDENVPIEYPSWWIEPIPTTIEFQRECQSLIQILNEREFHTEINILVTKELYRMLNLENDDQNNNGNPLLLHVQSAIAVAVGIKGMIFRVHAIYDNILEVVDVPIPFSSHGLLSIRDEHDPISLRNAVLFCIENVLQ